jgi:adenylate cyclase
MVAVMPQRERKLVAIMFTDMVGYTALAQKNESLSLALLDEQRGLIRPILMRHNGREVKTIGDAFLVVFPNALDAARCAYDIQRAVREFNISIADDRRIHLRVGVHLGDVVESDGDILGDAVNVASRIEPLADEDGVCLTRQVRDQVQSKINLQLSSMGQRSLKNVSDQIEVFKMVMPWENELAKISTPMNLRRIAVLPFTNISPDPQDEYFADGMTEEIISTISRVNNVEVISRTSVMPYKKVPKPVKEVSRELEVGTILEGSIRKAGNKLRITIQLIDASKDRHIWSESYDRNLEDVFAIQSEIAQKVADSLRLRLDENQKDEILRGPTKNMGAYNSYLAGLYNLSKTGPNWIAKSIQCFEQATALDPSFAQAYAALGTAYIYLAGEMYSPKEGFAKAKEQVLKALSLDSGNFEAHRARANLALQLDWDWNTTDSEFRRAVQLNPNSSPVHQDYALFLSLTNRDEEAITEISRAVELDPLSGMALGVGVGVRVFAREFKEAVTLARRIVELDPNDADAHTILSFAYLAEGSVDQAYEELQQVRKEISKRSSEIKLGWARGLNPWIYAISCTVLVYEKEEQILRKIIAEAEEYGKESYVSPADLAIMYLALGETERAFSLLNAEVQNHGPGFIFVHRSQVFDKIRSDPRFTKLLNLSGLPLEKQRIDLNDSP